VTGRLAGGQLDADAGLVYDGDGRWYDAALGVFLQPNPLGGAPESPGSLNRYASVGIGPDDTFAPNLSVNQGALNDFMNSAWQNFTKAKFAGQVENVAVAYLRHVHRTGRIPGGVKTVYELVSVNETKEAAIGWGYLAVNRLRRWVPKGSIADSLLDWAQVRLDVKLLENLRWEARQVPLPPLETAAARRAAWLTQSRWGKHLPGLAVGIGIDVGWQVGWDLLFNPDLTLGQRVERAAWEVPGSVGSYVVGGLAAYTVSGIASVTGHAAIGAAIGGPIGFAFGIGVAIVYDLWLKPKIYEWRGLGSP
jgi:hypothetical protein